MTGAAVDWWARGGSAASIVLAIFAIVLGRRDVGGRRRLRSVIEIRDTINRLIEVLEQQTSDGPALASYRLWSPVIVSQLDDLRQRSPGLPDRRVRRHVEELLKEIDAARGPRPNPTAVVDASVSAIPAINTSDAQQQAMCRALASARRCAARLNRINRSAAA